VKWALFSNPLTYDNVQLGIEEEGECLFEGDLLAGDYCNWTPSRNS